jgi:UDP-galactopyranose mutase
MLEGIEVRLNTNYFDNKEELDKLADKVVYTGAIDEYFNYSLGELEWRSLRFENEVKDCKNFQGNAVVNYTGHEVDYTRVIEHKHFEFDTESPKTVITYEYPADYEKGMEKYYTVNDDKNNELADKYRELAAKEENVIFGGRLAEYKYYDMDDVIKSAMDCVTNQ